MNHKSLNSFDILSGKASIFRVKNSGDVWQFRMWIAEEKKHLRKSLRTVLGRPNLPQNPPFIIK
jgi:hypothetical protein